jgi:hypothetical protein
LTDLARVNMVKTESVESPHFALLLEQISFNLIDSLI